MLGRLNSPKEVGFEKIRILAIAIRKVTPNQNHLGIIQKSRDGAHGAVLFHLFWHNDVKESVPSEKYCWVEPSIPADRLLVIATFCRLVYKATLRSSVPYAFSSPMDSFDPQTGAFLISPEKIGLTCASFVLGIFHRAGFPLVRYETWPRNRPEDIAWQQKIISILRKEGAGTDFLSRVESQVGNERFRPEEIASAALADQFPVSYEDAMQGVPAVLQMLSFAPVPTSQTLSQ